MGIDVRRRISRIVATVDSIFALVQAESTSVSTRCTLQIQDTPFSNLRSNTALYVPCVKRTILHETVLLAREATRSRPFTLIAANLGWSLTKLCHSSNAFQLESAIDT